MFQKTAIFIPSRLKSTRFPNKPLALIGEKPMIAHVIDRAREADIGDVFVACCEDETRAIVEKAGVQAVMTEPDLPSGSDRIFQALQKLNRDFDIIVNVQGDLPTIDPRSIRASLEPLSDPMIQITTLAAEIEEQDQMNDPNVVKAAISFQKADQGIGTYFSRSPIIASDGHHYHHIGLYTYRRSALEKFVSLPPSPLEKAERLEQLRAIEAGLTIGVKVVQDVPLGVDTPQDLEKAKKILG